MTSPRLVLARVLKPAPSLLNVLLKSHILQRSWRTPSKWVHSTLSSNEIDYAWPARPPQGPCLLCQMQSTSAYTNSNILPFGTYIFCTPTQCTSPWVLCSDMPPNQSISFWRGQFYMHQTQSTSFWTPCNTLRRLAEETEKRHHLDQLHQSLHDRRPTAPEPKRLRPSSTPADPIGPNSTPDPGGPNIRHEIDYVSRVLPCVERSEKN